jgi:hypothetical protein
MDIQAQPPDIAGVLPGSIASAGREERFAMSAFGGKADMQFNAVGIVC